MDELFIDTYRRQMQHIVRPGIHYTIIVPISLPLPASTPIPRKENYFNKVSVLFICTVYIRHKMGSPCRGQLGPELQFLAMHPYSLQVMPMPVPVVSWPGQLIQVYELAVRRRQHP